MLASGAVRKIPSAVLACSAVLWFVSALALLVFHVGFACSDSEIWCDTKHEAMVHKVTQVFQDFEISCVAAVTYEQLGIEYFAQVPVDCPNGVDAAKHTVTATFCSKGRPDNLRIYDKGSEALTVSNAKQKRLAIASKIISWTFIASYSIAFIVTFWLEPPAAPVADLEYEGRRQVEEDPPTAIMGFLTCNLVIEIPVFFILCVVWLTTATANPGVFVEAQVDRVLPHYDNFKITCSADVSIPWYDRHDNVQLMLQRQLDVSCNAGLQVAEQTEKVTVVLRSPVDPESSQADLVRQADQQWHSFLENRNVMAPPSWKYNLVVVISTAAMLLIRIAVYRLRRLYIKAYAAHRLVGTEMEV